MDMRETALQYAESNWLIFPCNSQTKAPMVQAGFKSASNSKDLVNMWWSMWPDSMIGVPTGEATGIWAVDCDGQGEGVDEFRHICAEHGFDPDGTLCQDTPSGGRHYIFRWDPEYPVRNSVKRISSHVDVRGAGGYVIFAPSQRADGRSYEWCNPGAPILDAPDWLLRLVTKKKEPDGLLAIPASHCSPYAEAALTSECERVASAPEGERNDTLNKAAFAIGTLVGGGEIAKEEAKSSLLNAAIKAGLPQREAESTIESGMEAGMNRPRGVKDSGEWKMPGDDGYVIMLDDLMKRKYVIDPAVEGLFDQGEIVQLNAKSGTGKGFICYQLALEMGAVPEKHEPNDFNAHLLWGRFPIPKMRRTLFIQAENRTARTQQKLLAMIAKNTGLEAALPNIGFLSFDNEDIRTSGSFMSDTYLAKVMEIVTEKKFDTVIFDPLVTYLDANENDNREVNNSLQRLVDFQKTCNATIVIVHHMGKNKDLDGRGASAIRAKADTMISFVRDRDKQAGAQKGDVVLTGCFEKIRHAPDGYKIDFMRKDGEFLLRPLTKEESEDRSSKAVDAVVEVLKDMGGMCEKVTDLQDEIASRQLVTAKSAARWITLACEQGAIIQEAVNGRQKKCYLPKGGKRRGKPIE